MWNQPQGDVAARDPSPTCVTREMQRPSIAHSASPCWNWETQKLPLLSVLGNMLILEVELKDILKDCLDFLPAGIHSGLICVCQGTEGHTWLQDSSSHFPLPDQVTSMYPVCPPSKERVFHKWVSPSFAGGGRTWAIWTLHSKDTRSTAGFRPLPRSVQIWRRCSHRLSLWEGEKIG